MHSYPSSSPVKESSAVRMNPALVRLRLLSLGNAIIFGVSLLLLIPYLVFKVSGPPSLHLTYYGTIIALALFSLLLTMGIALQMPAATRLEQKRQRAARGDRTLLAQTQPLPNEYGLALPFTLEILYDKSVLRKYINIFLLLFIITEILFLLSGFPFFGEVAFIAKPLLIIASVIFLGYLGYLFVSLIRGKPGNQLVVTQDGLIISKKYRVAWKDARLFAITVSHVNSRYASIYPLIFEVAGADSLVHIVWLQPENAKKNALRPLTSFEEYDRQMHALISVIAAKTGLPLYDLRKP